MLWIISNYTIETVKVCVIYWKREKIPEKNQNHCLDLLDSFTNPTTTTTPGFRGTTAGSSKTKQSLYFVSTVTYLFILEPRNNVPLILGLTLGLGGLLVIVLGISFLYWRRGRTDSYDFKHSDLSNIPMKAISDRVDYRTIPKDTV